MGRPFTGKESVSTFEETKPNGSIYVYERTTWYDQEKGYSRSRRKLIGKKDSVTGELVSTRPKKNPEDNNDTDSNEITIGKKSNAMISIIQHLSLISGVTEDVKKALGKDRGTAEKLLTLSWFTFATEGRTWTRAENWTQVHLQELPYSYGPITESIYQSLFVYLGEHEEIKWSIFLRRAERMGDGELIALDSTLIVCENKSVNDAKTTKNKEGTISGAYKVVYLYSVTARQLIAYAKIPGHIPDCSTVAFALDYFKALNLKSSIEIVQDNGYATELDLGQYLHVKRHFVTRLEPDCSWIQDKVSKYLPILKTGDIGAEVIRSDPEFSGVRVSVTHDFPYVRKYGSASKGMKAGDKEFITARINVFIYYSSYKQGIDDKKLREQLIRAQKDIEAGAVLDDELQKVANKYIIQSGTESGKITTAIDMKKYKRALQYHGLLIVAADKETDLEKALMKYRSRETIEEGIEGHKGHTGGDSKKCGSDDSVDGELFVEFLGNSMRESMRSKLREMERVLAIPNGDVEHDQKANLNCEAKVKRMIRKKSIVNILESFDRKYVTVVSKGKKKYEITMPQTKQDFIFLKKIGAIDE